MKRSIDDFPVQIKQDIAWGEMDSFQHVNNIVYFRYFESVRIFYFGKVKIMDIMKNLQIGPILAETQCKFIRPLSYPDQITIGAVIDEIQEDRFLMSYAVASNSNDNKLAAVGSGLVVYYDYGKNQKAKIPEEVLKGIHSIQKGK